VFQLFFMGFFACFVVLGMIRGVELARFDGVMRRVMAVTGGGIGVAGGGMDVAGFMLGHRFAVVMGGELVVVGRAGMMFSGGCVGGHWGVSSLGRRALSARGAACARAVTPL